MAVVDIDDIRSRRAASPSRASQAANGQRVAILSVEFSMLVSQSELCQTGPSHPLPAEKLEVTPQEEIALGPACW